MNCAPATGRHHYKSRHNYTATVWQGASGIPSLRSVATPYLLPTPCFAPIVSAHLRDTRRCACIPSPPLSVYKCLRHVAFNVSDLSRSEFCRAALPLRLRNTLPLFSTPLVAMINIWSVVAFMDAHIFHLERRVRGSPPPPLLSCYKFFFLKQRRRIFFLPARERVSTMVKNFSGNKLLRIIP